MPQITLAGLADTSVSPFSPAPQPSVSARPAPPRADASIARAWTERVTSPDAESTLLSSSPIAERFCGALALSALLGVGAATLLAHGASSDSPLAVLFGLCGVSVALLIQFIERRRAKILLTEAAIERGLEPAAARRDARERLQLWLS